MPKRKVKLEISLPPYPERKTARGPGRPGMSWRRDVYKAIMSAAAIRGVERFEGVQLECNVVVYMRAGRLKVQDVDNLVKHIFDALQGRLGGPKGGKRRSAVVPNDSQIRRVCVEKREARSKKLKSHLTVLDYVKSERVRQRRRSAS
jgi:Holliday junction resolvase RusA-like endonuclease